jgi:RNA polymerase sigma-70 factor (ECF subfamily)
LLHLATLNGDSSAGKALEDFCMRYRQPVVAFIRQRGFSPHEAEDLTHDFMLHLMEKSTLRRADAKRGRFRSFLLGALVRFLSDIRSKHRRLKRGGGIAHLSFDDKQFREEEMAAASDDSAVFDYEWALQLMKRAELATEAYYADSGRMRDFEVLRAYLPGGTRPPPYDRAAARLSMSQGAFKTEVHRVRARVRNNLRREIVVTVNSPGEIAAEIAYLGRVLQSGAGVEQVREAD